MNIVMNNGPARRFPRLFVLLIFAFLCNASMAQAQNSSLLHEPYTGQVVNPPRSPQTSIAPPSLQLYQTHVAPLGPAPQAPYQTRYQSQYQPQYSTQGPSAAAASGTEDRPNVGIDRASWTHQPAPPLRVFRKNDVITIRVDEIARVAAEGNAESRRRTLYEAILADMVRISRWRLRPDPQIDGDPAVRGQTNNNYRAESTIDSRESMTFNIAAKIVDIRANGNMLLEGKKSIWVNDNVWETSISGVCRAQDIAPDNVVLSKDMIDLEIRKQDQGHLRDGYKRGWFTRWFDRFQPF